LGPLRALAGRSLHCLKLSAKGPRKPSLVRVPLPAPRCPVPKAARALSEVARLVAARLLKLEFTEYESTSEWAEAAEHAAGEEGGPRGGSRALLLMPGLPAAAGAGAGAARRD
jgi:hypothetical protein